MASHWYILHTYSGYENKVGKALERLIKEELDSVLLQVKVPEESVTEVKNGRKRNLKKKFFPGYILIEMDIPEEDHKWSAVHQRIRSIAGVTGFLGGDRSTRPTPVPDEDVRQVMTRMGEIKNTESKPQVRISFSVGESVKVTDGPFKNFTGTIEDINHEKGTIRVNVEIFGRSTPVELDFMQAEQI